MLEIGSTKSLSVENMLWKRLGSCCKTDCRVNDYDTVKYACTCLLRGLPGYA
jgi:hypothetical protein